MIFRTVTAIEGMPPLRGMILGWMRKIERWAAGREAEARMREDLQRIAEVSPHLLADIGFEAEEAGTGLGRLWRRGRVRVWTED